MNTLRITRPSICLIMMLLALFLVAFVQPAISQINFTTSGLSGASISNPTSLQFGPDGRLYVSQQNGIIKAFTVVRNGANSYAVTATETISNINQIPNHNDDGSLNTSVTTRQITGILVAGTAAQPIIYVTSSDSRIGGGSNGADINLDTNSGILSLLTKSGSSWTKVDLVRGLPRSEENHSPNGLQLDPQGNKLYMAVGGFTNAGASSNNFGFTCEYVLSAAILSIDLSAINALPTQGSGNTAFKYNLPTLDDPTRSNSGGADVNDPFGGNDGLNQAKIVLGGPVQIFSPGYRNAYDFLITKTPGKAGRMYTIDNGANPGWGGYPQNEGTANVTNNYVTGEPGSTGPSSNESIVNNLDGFHYLGNISTYVQGSYYAGHPNPTRANPSGAGLYTRSGTVGVFRTQTSGSNPLPIDWPPVSSANPVEGDFRQPGTSASTALLTFSNSTNGLAEYTASNFNSALKGSLLAAGYDGSIYKISLTADGTNVTNAKQTSNKLNQEPAFASGFGSIPLDVIAQGDNDVFPGTVWAATYGANAITIFEPSDMGACTGLDNNSDDDADGYTNADEIDNNTNPCSASSQPPDFDSDNVSDLNDPDDDSDGVNDNIDVFQIDANNGLTTNLPINYELLNNNPGTGFFGLGFTGLMSNKQAGNNYLNVFNPNNLVAGGAVGAFTVVQVSAKDALGTLNNQENGFQFGVKVGSVPFTISSRMLGPFFSNQTPSGNQSQGIFIGTGDQSNYLKITMNANGGAGGIQVVVENADVPTSSQFSITGGIPGSTMDLYLTVNPATGQIQPKYSSDGGSLINVGSPIQVNGALLTALQSGGVVAVGVISTSINGNPFTATWDDIKITADPVNTTWTTVAPSALPKWVGHSVMINNKMYVVSGHETPQVDITAKVEIYNPATNTWTFAADMPFPVTHAGVTVDGNKIYVSGGFLEGSNGGANTDKLQIYDAVSNTWTLGPSLPQICGGNALVRVGRKLHSFGGVMTDRQTGNPAHYVLDLDNVAQGWTTRAPMPLPRCHFASAFVAGKIYALGGQTGHDGAIADVKYVQVYDPSTDAWTRLTDMPYSRSHSETGTFVMEGKVYLVGGRMNTSFSTGVLSTVTYYNPATDTWTEDVPLPDKLFGPSAEAIGNELIVSNGSFNACCSPQTTTRKRNIARTPNLKIGFVPPTLNLSVATGSTVNREVILWTLSGSPSFTINTSSFPSWLSVSPTSGTIDLLGGTEINITANASSLAPGNYSAIVTAKATGYPDAVMNISLVVTSGNTNVLYIYGSVPPGEVDMKLSSTGSTGMSQFRQALVDVGLNPTEAHDINVTLNATTLNQYKVLILGSNNRRFTDAEEAAVAAWVNAGGGLVAWSDAAFGWANGGLNSTNGLLSDNDLTQQFGIQFLRDNGAQVFTYSQWAVDHYINNFNKNAGVTIKAEGVSPVRTSPPATIVGALPPGMNLNSLDGPVTAADAALSVAQVGQGRVVGFFDRNAFWNAGAGTNINEVNNKVFAQRLILWASGASNTPTNTSPTANAGTDITITLPTNSVTLTGSGSDPGGSIAGYNWTKQSGPTQGTIASPTSASTNITGLVQGVYVFRLTVTDNDGATGFDEVTVTVNGSGSTTVLYRINAGGPQLNTSIGAFAADNFFSPTPGFTFSTSSAIGNTTDDALYQTERSATASNATFSYAFPVSNGTYTVILHFAEIYQSFANRRKFDVTIESTKVLDNYDIFAKVGKFVATTETFTATVTDGTLNILFSGLTADGGVDRPKVSAIEILGSGTTPTNTPPTANAGSDQTITLPANSVTLTGSGSDPGGSIIAYSWTKQSGPAEGTITSPNSTSTTVSGLVQGTYVFRLTVTDNGSPALTGFDEVTITVNGTTTNTPPTANAGADQTITLPANSVTLSGSGSDPGGSIVGYSWTKQSGPSGGTIASPTSASTNITGLVQGVYVFRLTVTDNDGATGFDEVTVTVNGTATTTAVYRINAGGPQINTSIGTFAADNFFSPTPGFTFSTSSAITGTSDPALYQNERSATASNATFSYAFPVSNGTYTVILHFAELYQSFANRRKFDVTIESTKVLDNYDIFAKVGKFVATTETFTTTVSDGTLNILFSGLTADGGVDRPEVVAIEILTSGGGSTNTPPTASAGANQTITLPTNSVTLTGSGSDPGGSIAGYSWTKQSGPAEGTIASPTSASTNITGLVQGVYVFRLTVTDNGSPALTGFDEVTVTVNGTATNTPPTASAGTDQTITLPTNSVTLTGSGSDPGGSITAYSWTKQSGPTQGAISSPSSASTSVTGLVQGTYVFRLTVTDNGSPGLTDFDEVTITVNGTATNTPPTANAGSDQTITLPTNSVSLTGSGSDPGGSITAYNWTKESGPAQGTIASPSSASTSITGLVQGTYVFRLTVTDNGSPALTGFDEVTVTVNGTATTTAVYRINAGGPQLTTSLGTFAADNFFSPSPGFVFSTSTAITGTSNSALYQTERSTTASNATFSYAFPVSNGTYTVVLHFAEIYQSFANRRKFDVTIESTKVLDNYDIFAKVGKFVATTETFTTTVSDGTLNILFSGLTADGGVDRPKVSAIEILSSTTTAPVTIVDTKTDLTSIAGELMGTPGVYPNPSPDGHFKVSLPGEYEGEITYSLISLSGSELAFGKQSLTNPASVLNFDFSQQMQKEGVYFLRIKNKTKQFQYKLMRINR